MTTEKPTAAQRIERLSISVKRGAVGAYLLISASAGVAMIPAINAAQALFGIQPDSHLSLRVLAACLGTGAVLIAALQLAKFVIIEREELLRRIGNVEDTDEGLPQVHIWPARNDMFYLGYSRDMMWTARRERTWIRYRFFTSWTLSRVGLQEGDPHISLGISAPLGSGEQDLRRRLTHAYRQAEGFSAARAAAAAEAVPV